MASIKHMVQMVIVDSDIPVRFIMRERPGMDDHVKFMEALKHGQPFVQWGVFLPNDDGMPDYEHPTQMFITPGMVAAASVTVMPS